MKNKQARRVVKELAELSHDPATAKKMTTFRNYQNAIDGHFEAIELTELIEKAGQSKTTNEQIS